MKKILLIANAFPPYKYVGRHRTVQYSKYLPKNGWEPIILTPTSSYLWLKDENSLKEIPKSVKVYRAFMPCSLPVLIKKLKGLFSTNQTLISQNASPIEGQISKKKYNLKQTIINCINYFQKFLDQYILIPGQLILWLPFALAKAIKIINNENVEIIYTSAPAYSMHILGCCIKIFTKIPWVADYRDLWTDDHSRHWLPKWRKRLEKHLEFVVMKRAERIIVVSRQMAHIMMRNFSYLNDDNFIVISNGFDSDYSEGNLSNYKKRNSFNIVHTGQIKDSTYSKFFLAIDELINENNNLAKNIELTFVGNIVESEIEKISRDLERLYQLSKLRFTGWVSHAQALEMQKKSDVLLLLIGSKVPNPETILTGKIFEYIIAQRPILALVPEGVAKEVILQTRTGITIHPEDIEGIKDAILELFKMWNSNHLYIHPEWSEINKYDRKNLTRKLAINLDMILQKHGR